MNKFSFFQNRYGVYFAIVISSILGFVLIYFILSVSQNKHIQQAQKQVLQEAISHLHTIKELEIWHDKFGGVFQKDKRNIDRSKYSFEIFSLRPLNSINQAQGFSKKALEILQSNPTQEYYYEFNKQNLLFVGALKTKQSCIKCHSNFQVGELRGGVKINIPTQNYKEFIETTAYEHYLFYILIGFFFVAMLLISFFLIRKIFDSKDEIEELKNKEKMEIKYRLDLAEAIIENTNEPFFVFKTDLNQNFVMANKASQKLLGKTKEYILRRSPVSFDYQLTEQMWESIKKNIEKKAEFEFEWTVIGKDQKQYNYSVMLQKIPFNQQEYLIANVKDITEKKQNERKLVSMGEKYQQSLDFARIGVWDWDIRAKNIKYSYQMNCILEEFDKDIVLQASEYENIIHPNDLLAYKKAIKKCLNENKSFRSEHRVVLKDGSHKWVFERGNITRDKSGNPTHMYGTIQDITRKKEQEKSLRQKQEELDKFNKLMIGRELNMIELKHHINALSKELGKTPPYPAKELSIQGEKQ